MPKAFSPNFIRLFPSYKHKPIENRTSNIPHYVTLKINENDSEFDKHDVNKGSILMSAEKKIPV